MRHHSKKWALLLLVVVVSLLAASCGLNDATSLRNVRGNEINVDVRDDAVLCIYGAGGEDGSGLIEGPILPGSAVSLKSYEGRRHVYIPISNRFYEMSKNNSRDAGASTHIRVLDKDGIPIHIQVKQHFVFNAEAACDWFDAHGLRNSSSGGLYSSENGANQVELMPYDMGFNARGGIVSPWVQVLNEQNDQVMKDIMSELIRSGRYGWEELTFEDAVEVDGVSQPVRNVIEAEAAIRFSSQFNEEYGDAESDRRFFCGTGHNQAKPDDCRDIRIQILDISPEDENLVTQRTELANQQYADTLALEKLQQQADFRAEQQRISEENADQKDDELDLEERLSAQRVRALEIAAEEAAAAEAARQQADVDSGLNELLRQQFLIEAEQKVAVCSLAGVTGMDCVYLIAVLEGIELPESLGGTFVVPNAP